MSAFASLSSVSLPSSEGGKTPQHFLFLLWWLLPRRFVVSSHPPPQHDQNSPQGISHLSFGPFIGKAILSLSSVLQTCLKYLPLSWPIVQLWEAYHHCLFYSLLWKACSALCLHSGGIGRVVEGHTDGKLPVIQWVSSWMFFFSQPRGWRKMGETATKSTRDKRRTAAWKRKEVAGGRRDIYCSFTFLAQVMRNELDREGFRKESTGRFR